jgi:hypothetical protein
MSPKFYLSLWILAAAAAVMTFFAGAMTMFALVVFGFLAFGLVFIGMMCVLPSSVAHQHELEHTIEPKPVKQPKEKAQKAAAPAYATLKSA